MIIIQLRLTTCEYQTCQPPTPPPPSQPSPQTFLHTGCSYFCNSKDYVSTLLSAFHKRKATPQTFTGSIKRHPFHIYPPSDRWHLPYYRQDAPLLHSEFVPCVVSAVSKIAAAETAPSSSTCSVPVFGSPLKFPSWSTGRPGSPAVIVDKMGFLFI